MSQLSPAPVQVPKPLILCDLGGLTLTNGGRPIVGAANHPARLVMLSVIARSGPRGISRDRLLALLWPESDAERARGALNQALYALRRDVGERELTLGVTTLRLNPDVIGSDADEFERAVEAGELEAAVRCYRGPFLDGVHIDAAAELDGWIEAQRERLARRHASALESLAAQATTRGDRAAGVEWWGRLAAVDPLNSNLALHYAQALVAAGDRAGALRHATRHEAALRSELDIAADPALSRFVQELRALTNASPSPAVAGSDDAQPVHSVVIADSGAAAGRIPPVRRGRTRRRWAAAAAIVAVGAALAARSFARHPSAALDRNVIAVMPFEVASARPALSNLATDVVVMFWMKLTGDAELRAVDPATIGMVVRGVTGAADRSPALDQAVQAASMLGAGQLVLGAVSGTAERVEITAFLHSVPDGRRLASYSVAGPLDGIAAQLDTLVLFLLAVDHGVDVRQLPALTRHKPAAIREYLAGLRVGDGGRTSWGAAIAHFANAVREDTTMVEAALAGFALGESDTALGHWVWDRQNALSERDRRLLRAYASNWFVPGFRGSDSPRLFEELAARYPDWGTPRLELANVYLAGGAWIGMADWARRARVILEELRKQGGGDLVLLLSAATIDGDTAAVRRAGKAIAAAENIPPFSRLELQWHIARFLGDQATVRRAWAAMDTTPMGGRLQSMGLLALVDGKGLGDAERALARLPAMSRPHASLSGTLAFVRGHYQDWLSGREQYLAFSAPLRAATMMVRDALYLDIPRDAALLAALHHLRAVKEGLGTPRPSSDDVDKAVCWLAQWDVAQGNTSAAAMAVRRFRADPMPQRQSLCAGLLEFLLVQQQGGDLRVAAARLDSIAIAEGWAGDVFYGLQNQLLARAFLRLGDAPRALAAARRRCYDNFCGPVIVWPSQVLAEARAATLLGDTTSAVHAYDAFLLLRKSADGPWRAESDSAKSERERLLRSRGDG